MATSDFCVEIDCGDKHTTLFFRFSKEPGGVPVLAGVDSDFSEFSVNVTKTLKPKIKFMKEMEYRKRKRETFYENQEQDSTEYTYDD